MVQSMRLRMELGLIPTIYPESLKEEMFSVLPNLTQLRKAPTERVFRPDEINSTAFMNPELHKVNIFLIKGIGYPKLTNFSILLFMLKMKLYVCRNLCENF